MGIIPELKTAFCGCSLKTGSKVIGWVSMVLGIMEFIAIAGVIGILALSLSNADDEKLGKLTIKILHDTDDPEVQDMHNTEAVRKYLMLLIGDSDTSDPELVGSRLRDQLQVVFTVTFLVILVVFLCHSLFTAIFLFGAYKNKSGYIFFYLVLSILGLIGYFPIIFNSAYFDIKICTFIGLCIHLYFTWVIYSFYKELHRQKHTAQSMTTMLLPGQKQADNDVPILVTAAIPDDFYYPQK